MNHALTTRAAQWLAVPLTVLLLCGMGVAVAMRPGPGSAAGFHEAVQVASAIIPDRIGEWVGADTEIPPAARKLLKPNVIRTRQYRHERTGETVTLLFVQCRDARDLAGHYPPICYASAGWDADGRTPRTWEVGDHTIQGMSYGFVMTRPEGTSRMTIYNFMALPDGTMAPDMSEVYQVAADYTRRHYGAAQFQLVMPALMSQDRRDMIFHQFMNELIPLLDVLTSGLPQNAQ